MSDTPDSQAGDLLVRVGAVLFALGALATVATMAPLFLRTAPLPSVAYLLCMLMGVGFAVAAAGVVRGVVAQRHRTAPASAGGSAVPPPSRTGAAPRRPVR